MMSSRTSPLLFEEAEERLGAGWYVPQGYIELLEADYDSAQRKRYLRCQHERLRSLLRGTTHQK